MLKRNHDQLFGNCIVLIRDTEITLADRKIERKSFPLFRLFLDCQQYSRGRGASDACTPTSLSNFFHFHVVFG